MGRTPPPAGASHPLETSSLYISFVAAIQFLLGLGLQVVLGYMFGARQQMDEYLVAVAIPQLVQVVISPALTLSIVPGWPDWEEKGVEREALGAALLVALALAASMTAGVIFMAHQLPVLLAPGLSKTADVYRAGCLLAALATAIVPQTLVSVLVASAIARRRHGLWPVAGTIGIALQLAVTWVGAPRYGIVALAVGYLVSSLVQFVLLAPYFPGHVIRWVTGFRHVVSLGPRLYPVVLKGTLTRFTTVSDRWIASWIGAGAIAQVTYGTRLAQALVTVLSSGLGATVLPNLSRLVRLDSTEFEETVIKGVRVMGFLTLPVSFVLLFWAEPLVRLVYARGAFTLSDVVATASVLRCASGWFAFSTVGLSIIMALYALEQHRAVSVISGITALLNLVLAYALGRLVGVWGISLAFSITAGLNLVSFVWLLHRIRGRFLFKPWRAIGDPNLVSLVAVALFLVAVYPRGYQTLPVSRGEVLSTLGRLALAGGLYVGLAVARKSPEAVSVGVAIRGILNPKQLARGGAGSFRDGNRGNP